MVGSGRGTLGIRVSVRWGMSNVHPSRNEILWALAYSDAPSVHSSDCCDDPTKHIDILEHIGLCRRCQNIRDEFLEIKKRGKRSFLAELRKRYGNEP